MYVHSDEQILTELVMKLYSKYLKVGRLFKTLMPNIAVLYVCGIRFFIHTFLIKSFILRTLSFFLVYCFIYYIIVLKHFLLYNIWKDFFFFFLSVSVVSFLFNCSSFSQRFVKDFFKISSISFCYFFVFY